MRRGTNLEKTVDGKSDTEIDTLEQQKCTFHKLQDYIYKGEYIERMWEIYVIYLLLHCSEYWVISFALRQRYSNVGTIEAYLK